MESEDLRALVAAYGLADLAVRAPRRVCGLEEGGRRGIMVKVTWYPQISDNVRKTVESMTFVTTTILPP